MQVIMAQMGGKAQVIMSQIRVIVQGNQGIDGRQYVGNHGIDGRQGAGNHGTDERQEAR